MKSLKKRYVGDLRIGAFKNWPPVFSGVTLVGTPIKEKNEKVNTQTKVMKRRIKTYEHRN